MLLSHQPWSLLVLFPSFQETPKWWTWTLGSRFGWVAADQRRLPHISQALTTHARYNCTESYRALWQAMSTFESFNSRCACCGNLVVPSFCTTKKFRWDNGFMSRFFDYFCANMLMPRAGQRTKSPSEKLVLSDPHIFPECINDAPQSLAPC